MQYIVSYYVEGYKILNINSIQNLICHHTVNNLSNLCYKINVRYEACEGGSSNKKCQGGTQFSYNKIYWNRKTAATTKSNTAIVWILWKRKVNNATNVFRFLSNLYFIGASTELFFLVLTYSLGIWCTIDQCKQEFKMSWPNWYPLLWLLLVPSSNKTNVLLLPDSIEVNDLLHVFW